MMKLKSCILFSLLLIPAAVLWSESPFSQPDHGITIEKQSFTIDGHVDGLQNGEKVILAHYINVYARAARYDSCLVTNNGDFHLKATAPEGGPYFFIVSFDDAGVRHWNWDDKLRRNVGGAAITLYVDNGQAIKIRGGDINKMRRLNFEDEVTIEGCPTQLAWASLKSTDAFFQKTILNINKKIAKVQDSVGYDRSLVQGLLEAKAAAYDGLSEMLIHPDPYFRSAIPLLTVDFEEELNDHASFEMDIYNSLSEKEKLSSIGKELKRHAVLAIGQSLPSFSLPTPEGQTVSLQDIVKKGKFTLVHFWASNSFDREKYQQELRVLYKKYNPKGLNVIAVSADSVDYIWKGIVQKEQYPWINVSDLKGNLKGGMVNDIYFEGGHSIPNTTNVLLDGDGKILAWDANGVVLQWYLWKYLGD